MRTSLRSKLWNADIDGAHAVYQLVHAEIPPGLEAIIKHTNMERRLGNLKDAFHLYKQTIVIEKGKEHSQTLPMLYAWYWICILGGLVYTLFIPVRHLQNGAPYIG